MRVAEFENAPVPVWRTSVPWAVVAACVLAFSPLVTGGTPEAQKCDTAAWVAAHKHLAEDGCILARTEIERLEEACA